MMAMRGCVIWRRLPGNARDCEVGRANPATSLPGFGHPPTRRGHRSIWQRAACDDAALAMTISIKYRNDEIQRHRIRLLAFSKAFSLRAQVITPRGSGILKGSGFGRGLRGLRGFGTRGAATVHGKSTANARHNGRSMRLACGAASSNATISGVVSRSLSWLVKYAALCLPASSSQPNLRGIRTACLRGPRGIDVVARGAAGRSLPSRNRTSNRSIRRWIALTRLWNTRVRLGSIARQLANTAISPRRIVRTRAVIGSDASREGANGKGKYSITQLISCQGGGRQGKFPKFLPNPPETVIASAASRSIEVKEQDELRLLQYHRVIASQAQQPTAMQPVPRWDSALPSQ